MKLFRKKTLKVNSIVEATTVKLQKYFRHTHRVKLVSEEIHKECVNL